MILSDELLLDIQLTHRLMPKLLLRSWMVSSTHSPYIRAFLWLTLRNHGSSIFILLTNIRMPPERTLRIRCVLEPI